MVSPRYFIAIFGDPVPPLKDRVQSGIYHPAPKFSPFQTAPGDVLLLYCTGGYDEYSMQAPGIGIVLETSKDAVQYRYLPLSRSISKEAIERGLEKSDADKFANRRFSSFWLFQISRDSFIKVIGDRTVVWT